MTEMTLCQEKTAPQPGPRIKLVALNARYLHSCLALFYIRNELALHLPQSRVELLQLTINDNSYESLLRITEGEPFAVFFSAAIWNSDLVERLVRDVHGCLPDCRIVVGGPQAGVLRELLPAEVCSMVIGEIEAVGQEFYQDLASGLMQPRYQGSFLRLKDKSLAFPYRDEDFASQLQNRYIYYESSRGCPYGCTYCLSAAERGLYHKDLQQVRGELDQILRHKPRVVRFVDRTFNDRPERALAIWEYLVLSQCDTLFHFEIAPDRFTEEMFAFLETIGHGRFQFEIGIQSTNPKTLEAIRRPMDTARVYPIIRRLAAIGTIHLHLDLILGLPYETVESFRTSFAEVFAMGAHYIQMGLLKILPDTPICQGAEEFGYIHSSHPPYSVFASNWLDHKQIGKLYWFCECVEKFHNNRYFVSLWEYLRCREEDIFTFFSALLTEGRKVGFLHRAATQELLCGIVVSVCSARSDYRLIADLLRYDWLRCGFRKLPDCLMHGVEEENSTTTRDILYGRLPEAVEGLYSARERNYFFKHTVFLRLSAMAGAVLKLSGPAGAAVRLVILPEREKTLYEHNRALPLDWIREAERR